MIENRIKQEYFFSAATIRDVVTNFKKLDKDWDRFPDLNAIHINDTQPALAPIELLRILVDEEGLMWDEAMHIVFHSTSFTTHSIHGAKDKWPCKLLERILPRHLELIYLINFHFIEQLKTKGVDVHVL